MNQPNNNIEAFEDTESPGTDFADEHDVTTVDPDVTGADGTGSGETESPRGWDGLEKDGAP
jgi:hypothetical protein